MRDIHTTPELPGAVDAAIVGVSVFPDRARVTRRGTVRLTAGEHRVMLDRLPGGLETDSVRVGGTGPATVLGVDVIKRFPARSTDETTVRLEEALREARGRLAALDDEDAVAAQRFEFYSALSLRATRSYAGALATGETDPARVAELADALAAQQSSVLQQRRALAERRDVVRDEIAAIEQVIAGRQGGGHPDFRAVSIDLQVLADTDVDLEVSYVVVGASWRSTYDLRLDGEALTLTWFGLVTQNTGEDWPECDLLLSTARPSGTATVPELDPWFLDRVRPMPMPPPGAPRAMPLGFGAAQAAGAMADDASPLLQAVATVEQGATAATYRPTRAVAVPADGTAHRATVAVVSLDATLDYITAPVRAAEAHLRATVTNTSSHTLPAGRAAVFHAGDFVGGAQLEVWAPGEEEELALGVDDRVRVERELVRRGAAKVMLTTTRRRDAEHRIRIVNHTPTPARITVLDQLPVSRDEGIVVKEQRIDPPPIERTDLGVITWVLELAPGESKDIHLGVRVEVAKGVEMVGWRE